MTSEEFARQAHRDAQMSNWIAIVAVAKLLQMTVSPLSKPARGVNLGGCQLF